MQELSSARHRGSVDYSTIGEPRGRDVTACTYGALKRD